VFTLLAYAWGVVCLLDAALAVWSFQFKGGVPAGKQEATYALIGISALAVTPLVLWALHVKRTIWSNSARAVELAALLRRVVTAAVAAYALAAGAGRLLPLFRPGRDIPLGEPVWGLLLGAAAFSIAAVVYLAVRGKSRA
jgi:serine/threonine-protein kinase